MGRNADKERARIVAAINAYLDRADRDASLGLSYDSIQDATGVSRGHLSRRTDEPEIAALVRRIAAIKEARNPAAAAGGEATTPVPARPLDRHAGPGASVALTDEGLARLIQRELREVGRLQEQWVSRHASVSAHDAPLALHDADELLPRLRQAVERVRPLVTEWNRRHGIVSAAQPTDAAEEMPAFL